MALAVAVGLVGLWWGWRLTSRAALVPARQAAPDTGFARVLLRKYYVDEIYDALIVRPLVAFSSAVLWKKVDQGVIDGAGVNGAARTARALGWLGGRLQTGQVGLYLVLFLAGALYVLHVVTR
jgi:NADH-quinone oxidoreductase subunit L